MVLKIMLSVSDVGTSEAFFVAAHECTSDSHMSNSFIRVSLLSLVEYLHEVICWQEWLQFQDRKWWHLTDGATSSCQCAASATKQADECSCLVLVAAGWMRLSSHRLVPASEVVSRLQL